MTKLVLDPTQLGIECPNASESRLYKVRVFGQVLVYDEDTATLIIRKIPTIPKLYDQVILTDETMEGTLPVNLFQVLEDLEGNVVRSGSIVNVIGYYNGNNINVVECFVVDSSLVASQDNINILIQTSNIKDFD